MAQPRWRWTCVIHGSDGAHGRSARLRLHPCDGVTERYSMATATATAAMREGVSRAYWSEAGGWGLLGSSKQGPQRLKGSKASSVPRHADGYCLPEPSIASLSLRRAYPRTFWHWPRRALANILPYCLVHAEGVRQGLRSTRRSRRRSRRSCRIHNNNLKRSMCLRGSSAAQNMPSDAGKRARPLARAIGMSDINACSTTPGWRADHRYFSPLAIHDICWLLSINASIARSSRLNTFCNVWCWNFWSYFSISPCHQCMCHGHERLFTPCPQPSMPLPRPPMRCIIVEPYV